MNIPPIVPAGIGVVLLIMIILAATGLIFYALRNKGDVRAQFSHGSTIFKIEAKDRGGSIARPRKKSKFESERSAPVEKRHARRLR